MSRLPRPYVPLSVRVRVIERQLLEVGIAPLMAEGNTLKQRLDQGLRARFGDMKVELHHRPSLINRPWNKRAKDFMPPANDERFLVYLLEDEHDIETRVRGQGAQLSDFAIARKRKRKERKAKKPKRQWPSRPLRSANRWPKRKEITSSGSK